jgi:hypothetical protein
MHTHNPPPFVIVQDDLTRAVLLAAGVVVAITYGWLCARISANNSLKPTQLRGAA